MISHFPACPTPVNGVVMLSKTGFKNRQICVKRGKVEVTTHALLVVEEAPGAAKNAQTPGKCLDALRSCTR